MKDLNLKSQLKSNTPDNSSTGEFDGRLKASMADMVEYGEAGALSTIRDKKLSSKKAIALAKANPLKTALTASAAVYYVGPKRVVKLAKLGLSIGIMSTLLAALNTISANDAKK